jgi:carboxypeptidase Q
MRGLIVSSILFALTVPMQIEAQSLAREYRRDATRIIEAARSDSAAYTRLTEMVDRFGARFSGSASLEQAIDWIIDEMDEDGLANVRGEPAMVTHWVRGNESATMTAPRVKNLPMLGLGGSIATPREGVSAPVMVVSDFEELRARAAEARGKIVLYDWGEWQGYGYGVQFRRSGAIEAAKVGAIASLISSVAAYSIQTPHTGSMSYEDGVEKIPHAAITREDASMIRRLTGLGERVYVTLNMEARTLPMVESRNVMGEVVGSEFPDEVIVLGGHIDSWDVGQGAMDDGGGVVAAWEAIRLIKELGLTPRRTIRAVGWTNEENGLGGGNAYRDEHMDALGDHILAMESDGGVFAPQGFGFTGSDAAFEIISEIGTLLEPIGAGNISRGGGGADIGPIMQHGVPGMGLQVDGEKYFWFHHTDADTIDKLDPDELARCVAAMAIMAYVVADMPERLPR